MSTHITTRNPVRSDIAQNDVAQNDVAQNDGGLDGTPSRTSRAWALAGIGAGVAGIGTIVASGMVNAVYDPKLQGDTAAIAERLSEQTAPMLAFHTFGLIGAVLLVVFAAGLQRRLRAGLGGDHLAPAIAFAGLVGTAVVTVLGTGLDTEFIMGFSEDQLIAPANAALYNHWIGTIPWCWVLAGVAALAVFSAHRAGAVPRWIGRTSLVLGGLTVLLGISPLQYMAGMTAPLWLLAVAIGFTVGDKQQA